MKRKEDEAAPDIVPGASGASKLRRHHNFRDVVGEQLREEEVRRARQERAAAITRNFVEEDTDEPQKESSKTKLSSGKARSNEVDDEGEEEDDVAEGFGRPRSGGRRGEAERELQRKRRKSERRALDAEEMLGEISGEESGPELQDEGGVPIEPFNLRAEREAGYFDAAGNYVERRREARVRDPWLEQYDQQVRTNKSRALAAPPARSRPAADEEQEEKGAGPEEVGRVRAAFEELLQAGETVSTALRRLSREKQREAFDRLTEAADLALALGHHNVYSDQRESLLEALLQQQRQLQQSAASGQEKAESSKGEGQQKEEQEDEEEEEEDMWEYTDPEEKGGVHGPFPSSLMRRWRDEGYFSREAQVKLRPYTAPPDPPAAWVQAVRATPFFSRPSTRVRARPSGALARPCHIALSHASQSEFNWRAFDA
jgi:CD2 antigen cytoplasmic tail-binding protein 2